MFREARGRRVVIAYKKGDNHKGFLPRTSRKTFMMLYQSSALFCSYSCKTEQSWLRNVWECQISVWKSQSKWLTPCQMHERWAERGFLLLSDAVWTEHKSCFRVQLKASWGPKKKLICSQCTTVKSTVMQLFQHHLTSMCHQISRDKQIGSM